jgi:hypothetical protein
MTPRQIMPILLLLLLLLLTTTDEYGNHPTTNL